MNDEEYRIIRKYHDIVDNSTSELKQAIDLSKKHIGITKQQEDTALSKMEVFRSMSALFNEMVEEIENCKTE